MNNLSTDHPNIYSKFVNGHHVLRCSDTFWSGIGCDLNIEQTLMKSVKGRGGLTHGSKFVDEQRSLWVLSTPAMCEYHEAMENFTKVCNVTTKDNHTEESKARVTRDTEDIRNIHTRWSTMSPFLDNPTLKNISTGVIANDNVNVHMWQSVGSKIIEDMVGQKVFFN